MPYPWTWRGDCLTLCSGLLEDEVGLGLVHPGNHLNSGEHNILQAGRVPGFHQGDDVRQPPADIGGLYTTDLAQCTTTLVLVPGATEMKTYAFIGRPLSLSLLVPHPRPPRAAAPRGPRARSPDTPAPAVRSRRPPEGVRRPGSRTIARFLPRAAGPAPSVSNRRARTPQHSISAPSGARSTAVPNSQEARWTVSRSHAASAAEARLEDPLDPQRRHAEPEEFATARIDKPGGTSPRDRS